MAPKTEAAPQIVLPLSIVGPVDIGRVLRELEAVDNIMNEASLKNASPQLPKLGKLLDDLCTLNKADLKQATHRKALIEHVQHIHAKAPVLHISFSAEPSALFTDKLMGWLRNEIHPQVLLTIGMQPSIGAGCVVRTTNKFFDFTLRANFTQKRALLMESLSAVAKGPAA